MFNLWKWHITVRTPIVGSVLTLIKEPVVAADIGKQDWMKQWKPVPKRYCRFALLSAIPCYREKKNMPVEVVDLAHLAGNAGL